MNRVSGEKMRAALLYGVKDLRVENIDRPKVGADEVLVGVKAATTCGTDTKIFQRGYVEGVIHYRTIFGHEWAGV
ncbi:MAG: alcohol dehydrogenase catalytic domain-containing protein, partial [Candidatus Bathyarchaeota archaeon]